MWFKSDAKFKGVLPWPVCNLSASFMKIGLIVFFL